MEQAKIHAEISQHLRSAGLHLAAPWGPYLGWADLLILHGEQTDPNTGITYYREAASIAQAEGQWCFRVLGPSPESMDHRVATPEEIVTVAVQFFFGHSLSIEGWTVPLHRHPEWNEPDLRVTLAHAQRLAPSVWPHVRHQTNEHYGRLAKESAPFWTNHPREDSWGEWYSCQFVPIKHENPSHGEKLWLRRDLREAYLVRDM